MFTRQIFQRVRRIGRTLTLSLLVLPIFAAGIAPASALAAQETRQQYFKQAAQEFGVPENLLMALSYNESRWSAPAGQMSMDGGYGNMNLRAHTHASFDGRGSGKLGAKSLKPADYYTLDRAASLLHTSTNDLKHSDKDNIRGGAAVLADYAKKLHGGKLPGATSDWYDAVAKYSGSDDAQTAQQFADDVFSTLQKGESSATTDHQSLSLKSDHTVQPQHDRLQWMHFKHWSSHQSSNEAECPSTLNCTFVPAAYQQNSSDPADYGSFDYAHRPKDMDIKYIVIHDTEGSYDSAIAHFQDPTAYVSGNYIIRSSDGAITQMVHNKDVSWGAGDWYVNMHAINIEHEGFAAQGGTWYTEAMYQSSAKLVRYLAAKYHIPLDRQHIIGHDNVPRTAPALVASQHNDPGPYWDWNHYMELLHGDTAHPDYQMGGTLQKGQVVTISPNFTQNQPPVQDCSTGTCTDLPVQGSNFVYLRTQPNASAPLLSDPYLHTDHSAGTTDIGDWSARAISGEKFVVADVQGDWTAIYYGGQEGWFYNPASARTAHRGWSFTLKARNGLSSLPIYGVAYPEASAYPSDVPVQNITQLYTAPSDQSYTTAGRVPTDYFYDATIDYSLPHDHIVVRGHDKYYQIWFNQRIAYVKASDVDLSTNW